MNYKIINDEQAVKDFINLLPDLGSKDLVYYVCLFARSKYLTEEQKGEIAHIKSDKAQLKRFTATKETLLSKLKQLECPLGSYVQYKQDVPDNPVPQESLAVYMSVNPRSLSKASVNSLKKFVDMVTDNKGHFFHPSNFAMSEIQRSKGRTDFVVFDVDSKDISVMDINHIVDDCCGYSALILETRGGYHVMVDPNKVTDDKKKTWYNNLQKQLPCVDQVGDIMIPIPGTYQGGFTPKIY